MKAGIIGLPSVGKTTIFNVLTQGKAAAGPARAKLEPNVGIVKVPDARLDFLSSKFNPEKTTYATVEFVDVQGLVRGKGPGHGAGAGADGRCAGSRGPRV